jgi:hypothetical protein
MKYYAGIGSRNTPPEVLARMTQYAQRLHKLGYILRSGGATGADQAFEKGIDPSCKDILRAIDSTAKAEEIAKSIHPAWGACTAHAKRLHGRNCQIILGKYLDKPVEFVICWTQYPDRGGTRTGIVLAKQHGLTVYNLVNPAEEQALEEFLKQLEGAA